MVKQAIAVEDNDDNRGDDSGGDSSTDLFKLAAGEISGNIDEHALYKMAVLSVRTDGTLVTPLAILRQRAVATPQGFEPQLSSIVSGSEVRERSPAGGLGRSR